MSYIMHSRPLIQLNRGVPNCSASYSSHSHWSNQQGSVQDTRPYGHICNLNIRSTEMWNTYFQKKKRNMRLRKMRNCTRAYHPPTYLDPPTYLYSVRPAGDPRKLLSTTFAISNLYFRLFIDLSFSAVIQSLILGRKVAHVLSCNICVQFSKYFPFLPFYHQKVKVLQL